ncbi:hypothetical protein [Streptosporangium carneum]|uniref:DUF2092 domain-containing protein n=1 Tax=Streptosporangium carneum TaxID=47481 RepID=A0A9W6HY08_9ACTN|nr:hypothetical protein [Streptosporangium carneum]GLK07474.1 hypothetical protein GCM10017600_08790 [Streptosporangium carneum]
MRRWAALAVAVLLASVPVAANPAAAQAGAPDPARAIKRQFRNEHGVRIAETIRHHYGRKPKSTTGGFRVTGGLQFGPSGPVAADFTWWNLPRSKSEKPDRYRVIRVGKDAYDAASVYPGPVPDGKKWIRFQNKHRGLMGRDLAEDVSLQPFDVYDATTMRTLLKRSASEPVSGGLLHRGVMSYRELSEVSKGAYNWVSGRPVGRKSKGKVSWRLWTGRDGLPERLITVDTMGDGKDPLIRWIDTRYTDWGFRLVVTAPPADEVIDEDELMEYSREQNADAPTDSGNT